MRAVPVLFVVLLALAACGGTTVTVGDSSDGGGASSSSSDGSTCQGPSCNEQCTGKPLPRCTCGKPICSSGRWECPGSCADKDAGAGADAAVDAAVDASATFPCGGLLVCHSAAEYCKIGVGGPAGAQPSYACEPIPAACASNVACACIKPAVGGQLCSDAPGVTVTFEYP